MYESHPPRSPAETMPTMYDLPSEDPEDLDLSEEERAFYTPKPPSETMPTMYDLPSEDPEELGLPDEFHDFQPKLLRETCRIPTEEEFFIGADLNLYYDPRHPKWHKRPDWFLCLGVDSGQEQADLRWSYLVWQEGVNPFLVIELLSPGTEAEDLGQTLRIVGKPPTKWQVYEQILRIPYYGLFDRYTNQFRLFRLSGTRYQELVITGQGHWFEELNLGLGVWSGIHLNIQGEWLRWYDRSGQWIPTPQESAGIEKQRADRESQRANEESQRAEEANQIADRERQRAEILADRLRQLGIDPDSIT
jgi:Uma2 family endonuclease